MDLSSPLLDIAPDVRGALLQTLARLAQPVTRRRLAAMADVAPGHASSVIGELIQAGLVLETVAGRASMVELNRNHLASAAILALTGLRGDLILRLRERLSTWDDLHEAWLFGSVARGEATGDSDIDLLIIVDDPQTSGLHERLALLYADVRSWTGNELQVMEHSVSSWQKLVETENSLV
ncbi:MAG TPA: nucleotidyltransferase domain-containing protein, partial [Acidimicrobiales bacterium]|nr:nucleotidyltransferase domain-containing protein [Acidimicrobiales bacterium]